METLKEIVNYLKIIGISIAGIGFIILMIKIAVEPEMKAKYLKLIKHLLIATVFITISLSEMSRISPTTFRSFSGIIK